MSGNGRGNTLGGGPASDPPPSTWGRPSAPRIGRIGEWDNNAGSRPGSSKYVPRPRRHLSIVAVLTSAYSSGRLATFSSLASSNAGPPRHPIAHDDDDDDDDDDDEGPPREGESWFAGGERRYAHTCLYHLLPTSRPFSISGISVQNPNVRGNRDVPGGRLVSDILRRAAECVVYDDVSRH